MGTEVDSTSPTFERSLTVRQMFPARGTGAAQYTWVTDAPYGSYASIISALIQGVPLPKVYVHERDDGLTFDVVKGGEIIEALRNHAKEAKPHPRVLNARIDLVIFRCSLPHVAACRYADFLKNPSI